MIRENLLLLYIIFVNKNIQENKWNGAMLREHWSVCLQHWPQTTETSKNQIHHFQTLRDSSGVVQKKELVTLVHTTEPYNFKYETTELSSQSNAG